jgi:hypothetical protein
MLKISDAVAAILAESDLALEAMRVGILNLSAFAEQIQPQVEAKTWKSVKKATIVVALARLAKQLEETPALRPVVALDELSIKSPLCDVTFEKTTESILRAKQLTEKLAHEEATFLTVTQSTTEITVIAAQDHLPDILQHFNTKPKAVFENLVGLTVRFSPNYIPEPNVIYSIISTLAHKRINLIEIVSTFTELTMVIYQTDLEIAVQQLNTLFKL